MAALTLRLVEWQGRNFALIRPLVGRLGQTGPARDSTEHGPIAVNSFRCLEAHGRKSLLPVWLLKSTPEQALAQHGSQCLHPLCQSQAGRRHCNEQMAVIGHEDVASDGNVILLCSKTEGSKRFMDFGMCKHRQTFISIKRYKIKGTGICKEPLKSRRATRVTAAGSIEHGIVWWERLFFQRRTSSRPDRAGRLQHERNHHPARFVYRACACAYCA